MIHENGPKIANDGRFMHCWTGEDNNGESVIDLRLANRPIMKCTILADENIPGSDQEVVERSVHADRQEEADQTGSNWVEFSCNDGEVLGSS